MTLFTISDLQKLSGIKAHTIRIWEQRYDALHPERSEGNTRYYNSSQLKRLLNIVSLLNLNYKVSKACLLNDTEIHSILQKSLVDDQNGVGANELLVSQLITSAIEFNESLFDKTFLHALTRNGLKDTYTKIIYPMLNKLGLMWSSSSLVPAQEHFITNLIRQKLCTAIDALPNNNYKKDKWLLFLPEGEFHEMGLLLANYLIRLYGYNVIYLGANVPFNSIEVSIKNTGVKNVLLFLVSNTNIKDETNYVKALSETLTKQKVFVATANTKHLNNPKVKNINFLKSVDELENYLKTHV